MKKILTALTLLVLLCGCKRKSTDEGSIIYQVEYQLPDSLKQFAMYLPKEATVYFKGDSTVSIQKSNEESTTIITDKKTGFMRALLKSPAKQYVVDYSKAEQSLETGHLQPHTIAQQKDTKTIAGFKAVKYLVKDKLSGETTEMWFTKDISIIPNSLTLMLDPALGVPLEFTINQNGVKTKTTVKEVRFEPVPASIFATPTGFVPLTPQQLREMPVGN
ncbi:DUF4412 domain-containing protein [Mucilaginibacter arboris]|uniref:DUF4412 domain-containing protein n=1 Tax=Mucilaginibacter arboris TaxID=2682090 RepID=A0A7K1STZ6_9SPHI|nr:DUF4412 domain-containing protein [Mucilaginibacter arboris]MVN20540.1 DUF4412 domain-containing protein [Mucilaginibacter arboris]